MASRKQAHADAEPATKRYAVGYSKPPKASQFKKGRSGNPLGRPKHSRNVRTVLNEELGARVKIREQGKTKSATKLEIFIRKTVNEALQGREGDAERLIKLLARYLPPEPDERGEQEFPSEDEAIVRTFLAMMQKRNAADSL